MHNVFDVASILVSHAVKTHRQDIAIIAYYGSHATGSASPNADLDMFYIPDEGKASTLSSQFVFDGLPYDFWPVSWQLAERIAGARHHWAVAASMIAHAQVLYHRSQQDLDRFVALKKTIEDLTAPEGRETMVGRALDEFRTTLFQLGQVRLAASIRDRASLSWAVRKFVNSALNCLALVNQTYFTKGWGANMPQVLQLPKRPAALETLVESILSPNDPDMVTALAERLAGEVRVLLLHEQASLGRPVEVQLAFKDFYFFIVEYVNKVLSACERRDTLAASYAAFMLQEEISRLLDRVERGFEGTDFNLLGEYGKSYASAGLPDLLEPACKGDLAELARRAQSLQHMAGEWLRGHSVDLGIMHGEDDLRRFLAERDPGTVAGAVASAVAGAATIEGSAPRACRGADNQVIGESALATMRRYYGDRQKSIDHTLRVLDFAEQIWEGERIAEGFLRDVITLAAIFHDIGIPESLRQYGTSAHEHQEKEGPPIARRLMTEIGVRHDILERVCHIVGHHHTRASVDGPDFQVVWEADALVNIPARGIIPDPAEQKAIVARNFKTTTGTRLIKEAMQASGSL